MPSEFSQIQIQVVGNTPQYATVHAAGADLQAQIKDPITIPPMKRVLIPTGTFLAIPNGFEGQIRPRSGLSITHGITLLNAPGTIDADYRGEIKVPIINLGEEAYTISPGDRIAQLIISPCIHATFSPVSDLPPAYTRGKGGFGSTGYR